VAGIELTYLSGADVDRLGLAGDAILDPVADVLAAQGRGEVVLEPRVHLFPGAGADGHFNVLRGSLPRDGVAGVKVVGDFVDNGRLGLPSELALLLLMDPATGVPLAIVDATAITAMRTGAVSALSAKYAAPRRIEKLALIGCGVQMRTQLLGLLTVLEPKAIQVFDIVDAASRAFVEQMSRRTGRTISIARDAESAVREAQVMV